MSVAPDDQTKPKQVSFFALFPSIMLPMFIGMLDQTIVATALPAIGAELGRVEFIAWVVVAYLVAAATAAPVYGRLGDALGRQRLLIVAICVSTAGSLLCAFSVSAEMLIASRVLQGLGGGGLIALSQALIGQTVPPRERARYQGYIASIGVTSSTVGPVIGGFLTEYFGWRAIFFFNVPFALLAILLVLRLPAVSRQREPFRFDWQGLLLFACFVWSLLILVETLRGGVAGGASLSLWLAAGVVVSAVLLYRREKRADQPLLPITLLQNPSVWRADALAMAQGAIYISLITFTPIYLRAVHGAPASEIGLLMLPMTVSVGVGGFLLGQFVSRTGRTAIFPSLGLLVAGGLLLVMYFLAGSMSPAQFAATGGAIAFFLGSVMGVVQITVQSEAGAKLLGSAAAGIAVSRSIGAALGTAIVGAVLAAAMAATGVEMSGPIQAVLQGGEVALAELDPEVVSGIRDAVGRGFESVFLVIFVFTAIGAALSWTIPRRTI